jgi:Phospholipase D-like domain at C-terminus of MIT
MRCSYLAGSAGAAGLAGAAAISTSDAQENISIPLQWWLDDGKVLPDPKVAFSGAALGQQLWKDLKQACPAAAIRFGLGSEVVQTARVPAGAAAVRSARASCSLLSGVARASSTRSSPSPNNSLTDGVVGEVQFPAQAPSNELYGTVTSLAASVQSVALLATQSLALSSLVLPAAESIALSAQSMSVQTSMVQPLLADLNRPLPAREPASQSSQHGNTNPCSGVHFAEIQRLLESLVLLVQASERVSQVTEQGFCNLATSVETLAASMQSILSAVTEGRSVSVAGRPLDMRLTHDLPVAEKPVVRCWFGHHCRFHLQGPGRCRYFHADPAADAARSAVPVQCPASAGYDDGIPVRHEGVDQTPGTQEEIGNHSPGSLESLAAHVSLPGANPAPAVRSWDLFSAAKALDTRAAIFLQDGETGRSYEALFKEFYHDAQIILLCAPYVLRPGANTRLCQFVEAVVGSPQVEQIVVYTDAVTCAESKQVMHQLQAAVALKGVNLHFRLIENLHDRDLYFIGDSGTWRVQSDRGIDYFQRGPLQLIPETARCKRTKIEVTKLAVFPREVREHCEQLVETSSVLAQVDEGELEKYLANKSVVSLRRKLRGALALFRKQQAGETLDPWQRRKCRLVPTLMAAVRLSKHMEQRQDDRHISTDGLCRSLTASSDSEDRTQSSCLAEVVRHGQRCSAFVCRAWAKFSKGLGWQDPRKYGRRFLVKFLGSLPCDLAVDWGLEHGKTLRSEGIPHWAGVGRQRGRSDPAAARPKLPCRGLSLPGRGSAVVTETGLTFQDSGTPRLCPVHLLPNLSDSPFSEVGTLAVQPGLLPAVPAFPVPQTFELSPERRQLFGGGLPGHSGPARQSRTMPTRGRNSTRMPASHSRAGSACSMSSTSSCRTWVSAHARGRRGHPTTAGLPVAAIEIRAEDIPAGPELDEDFETDGSRSRTSSP